MNQYLDFNGVKILVDKINELNDSSYPIVSASGVNEYIGSTSKIKSLKKGTKMTLFVDTDSTSNCSLNLNSYGVKTIKDSLDNIVNNLKKDIPYNICYNGTDFILQDGIDDGESIYISDEEPDKDGIWISSDNTTTASDNPTLLALKGYVDEKLGTAELTTDDKTIKGAINEHETQINKNTARLEEINNSKANSNHTHDDRYYTESEINTKLNDKVNFTKSNDYNFDNGEGKNNIRRIEVNGNTLTNSPNGNNGGVVFEFVGSHGRWNTQQYNDQQGRMWYRNSYDYDGGSTKWNSWKEVSLNEKTVNPQLLNGWQYWSDANHGQIFAKTVILGMCH